MRRATWALGLSCFVLSCGSDRHSTDAGRDAPQTLSEDTAAMCQDGSDNDGDGFADCADQDCWPLTFCAAERPDGWRPPSDASDDAPHVADGGSFFDTGLQSCAIHYDCSQGEFCYRGKCLRDPKQAVFHCGKAGCPPGHWCLTPANAKERCAEDPKYACRDACDCGPAHCCIDVPSLGGRRCVKDLDDAWLPGGELLDPSVTCRTRETPLNPADATYCCALPECQPGLAARAGSGFRCHDAVAGARSFCGGSTCSGTACHCAAGQSCVDTLPRGAALRALPPPGKICDLFSGGTCVSQALAEAVFNFAADELLACCGTWCSASTAGQLCDGGAFETAAPWAYQRLIARCDPAPASGCACGDGICCASEIKTCAADCRCGDAVCQASESAASCPADCNGRCGDGRCDPASESAASCPADCAGACGDSALYGQLPDRVCGDGVCGPRAAGASAACDWSEIETCRTCALDCGACEWRIVHGDHRAQALSGTFRGVWGSSPTSLFAVGDMGTIVRYDGSTWQPMTSGTSANLRAVWGSSPSDVFAVGLPGAILHYDGSAWSAMPGIPVAPLAGVWGSSPTNVFAVGHSGIVLRYDGSAWTPMVSGTTAHLTAVWGSAPNSVFAVGAGGTALRYDGNTWAPIPTGRTTYLNGVWGSSPTNAFAVGGASGTDGEVLHYDGNAWSVVASTPTRFLGGVWGSSPTNVFAVGDKGTIVRYDGSAWTPMATGSAAILNAVWGTAAGEAFAAGSLGTVLRHANGVWTQMTSGAHEGLLDVWASSASDVFAVGHGGKVLHGDGRVFTPMVSGSAARLWSVWGSSAANVFAVGDAGTLLRHDGSSWSAMPAGTAADLKGVWGTSASDVLAVGFAFLEGAVALRYNGNAWSATSTGSFAALDAVWASSPTNAFAVGGGGAVLRYDGSSWTQMPSGTPTRLNAVWGDSPTSAFAVGSGGVVVRYDGSGWSPMAAVGTSAELEDVWGTSAADVVAVGYRVDMLQAPDEGTAWHFDGHSWSSAALDLRERGSAACRQLYGVGGAADGTAFIVGEGDLILRRACPAGGCAAPAPAADGGAAPPDAGAPTPDAAPAAGCPDGRCELGESCDGRAATVACPLDCPGANLGHPQKEYCFVNGVCVGPGCP